LKLLGRIPAEVCIKIIEPVLLEIRSELLDAENFSWIICVERVENFKYLAVILNEDINNQIDLQERIKNVNKTYFMLQIFFRNKNISKKLQLD
jgi:hypothetical protein